MLVELGGLSYENTIFTSQKLSDKLNSHYREKINIDTGNKKRGNIVFGSELNVEEAVRIAFDPKMDSELKLRDAAFSLRKSILNAKHEPLPDNLTL